MFGFGVLMEMDHAANHKHEHTADPHAGHKMSAAQGSHDRHAGHSVAMFRDKFWLSLALTIPVVVWSADVQHWIGYRAAAFPGSKLIPPILGTIVFLYGGIVFIRGAWRELASRKPGMMALISLAILVAFSTSLAATFGVFEVDVWWELATLITIMVLGHWLEMKAIAQAHGALDALAALLPDTAERVSGSSTEKIPISQLRVEDVVLVRPGERVPADGIVVEGTADVDESMITGESQAVSKAPGVTVIAGTVTSGSSLRVRVTAVGEKTAISGIMRLVATAQASGSRTQALADRAAAILFYVALGSGVLTFAYWWMAGD
jgi:Cu2+-exporting ATPase